MNIALVTGAYKGLGFEWCKQLAQEGYTVILSARDLDQADAAAGVLREQGLPVHAKALDVTNETQLKELAAWTGETFGQIDLIINNAGINPKDYRDKTRMAKAFYLSELDANEMLEVFKINSLAPLLVVKHFRHLLHKSEKPMVVNISSWLGSVTKLNFGGHYGYVGSKNLLNVLNKSMANELRNEGIVAVNVNPGWVQTDMGGTKAQFTPEQAVQNILTNVVRRLSMTDTGTFFNFDGTVHPW